MVLEKKYPKPGFQVPVLPLIIMYIEYSFRDLINKDLINKVIIFYFEIKARASFIWNFKPKDRIGKLKCYVLSDHL